MLLSRVRALIAVVLAGTLAIACGRDGVPPLTAPSISAVAGVYGLKTINGAPPSPTGEIISDTLVLWDDGLIGRRRLWRAPLNPSYVGLSIWSGMYTLTGVTITATYSIVGGAGVAQPLTETGTLFGQGTVVKRMTVVQHDSVFVYDKAPIP